MPNSLLGVMRGVLLFKHSYIPVYEQGLSIALGQVVVD